MDRWACVDVPALPLQLLLRHHRGWARYPVAVVDRDHPQGEILWINERARQCRIRVGQRYAAALSLAADLHADVIVATAIEGAVERLTRRLRRFTPEVEPNVDEPGVFWLNATGLEPAQPCLRTWARNIVTDLREVGLQANVTVGFDRFATYALARAAPGVQLMETPAQEQRQVARVPLDLLQLDPKTRDAFARLGVDDVGALRALPPGGVLDRFGAEGSLWQRRAAGTTREPLDAAEPASPVRAQYEVDPEQHGMDLTSLLFLLKGRLGGMCVELARRGAAVAGLQLTLLLDDVPGGEARCEERVCPAAPTLDEVQLLDLVRLRLEATEIPGVLIGFTLEAEAAHATREQLQLFEETPRRDLRVANRALASLRAEFGAAAVVRAALRDGHLPHAQFAWEPIDRLLAAKPDPAREVRLVRRLQVRPCALPHQRREADGWLAGGLASGSVERLSGPYRIAGGWWGSAGLERDYYFAQTRSGDVLWIFYDGDRRRWYRHGAID